MNYFLVAIKDIGSGGEDVWRGFKDRIGQALKWRWILRLFTGKYGNAVFVILCTLCLMTSPHS